MDLQSIKATAVAQMNANPDDRWGDDDDWENLLDAIERVEKMGKIMGEWAACLKCGTAWSTPQALSHHYARAHR